MFEIQSFSCSSKDTNEPSQDKSKCITTRQRSCAFINTPLPCINKAIHHIQELEVKLEKCFQQYDHVFKEEKIPWKTEKVSAESNEDTWLSLSTRLDFQDANVSCKEYETHTQDMLELQWHFDCKSRQLQQVENQVLKIETVNRKIQEDIDFMKKHSPLLEEKLNLEGEAMKDVLLAYGKIEDLNNKIAAQGNENIKILDACSEVMKATEKLKSTWEGNLQTIKQKLLNISEALNDLKCENGELQGENEEFLQKSANRSHLAEIYHLTFLSST
ncbi:coiled-coil domain-containing protein 178 isoform X1 [Dromaius novaehollandiae]|uniref:coiled-coil domain-containing protein 178 isoform X1 n=1 Tax=Dromaius novaehollandiae TaxID=8790 RepID=UPI00311E181E